MKDRLETFLLLFCLLAVLIMTFYIADDTKQENNVMEVQNEQSRYNV